MFSQKLWKRGEVAELLTAAVLDLGTVSNLLIETVGEIIRAQYNVLIVEGSGFRQGGRGQLLGGGVGCILRLFFGEVLGRVERGELEAGLEVGLLNGEVDIGLMLLGIGKKRFMPFFVCGWGIDGMLSKQFGSTT